MPTTTQTTPHAALSRLRAALPRQAGAIVVLALLLAGMQLALQTHLIEHDLLPSNHPVCEQCVVAKGATPPPALVSVVPPASGVDGFAFDPSDAPLSRAPLVVRSRAPPFPV